MFNEFRLFVLFILLTGEVTIISFEFWYITMYKNILTNHFFILGLDFYQIGS